jgi:hypothetical protein
MRGICAALPTQYVLAYVAPEGERHHCEDMRGMVPTVKESLSVREGTPHETDSVDPSGRQPGVVSPWERRAKARAEAAGATLELVRVGQAQAVCHQKRTAGSGPPGARQ